MNIDLKQADELFNLYMGALLGVSQDPERLTPGWAQRIQAILDFIDKKELDPVDFNDAEVEEIRKKLKANALKFEEYTKNAS